MTCLFISLFIYCGCCVYVCVVLMLCYVCSLFEERVDLGLQVVGEGLQRRLGAFACCVYVFYVFHVFHVLYMLYVFHVFHVLYVFHVFHVFYVFYVSYVSCVILFVYVSCVIVLAALLAHLSEVPGGSRSLFFCESDTRRAVLQ